MKKVSFIVRPMQPGDISDALKLSNAEGWNQTESDWEVLLGNSQNPSLVAEWENKIIGTTTAINYSNNVAWIGMVLVDKQFRGQGISKSLLINVFDKLESCKSIKLDATPAGHEVYKKFEFEDEYFIVRMINSSVRSLPMDNDDIVPELIQLKHIPEIAALDEVSFGANRIQLIEYLIRKYPGRSWSLNRNNQIVGFALGRDGDKYHHIGPVMASTRIDAKILIKRALREFYNQPVVVDVLYDKEDLLNWLHSIGFIKQRDFVRMYKKQNPFPGVIAKQFLICGPEFG